MAQPGAGSTKWSDHAFLDSMRNIGDALADKCARELPRDESLAFMFTKMRADAAMPVDFPDAFAAFLRDARPSLDLSDLTAAELDKLKRGQQVFMRNALPTSLVLLSKSLQEGYQAPRLGRVLMISGELEGATYRRVLGVLQMMLQVATPGSFDPKVKSDLLPASDAGLTAIKVRLMHAGIRGIAKGKFPDFDKKFGGVPISLEDMLATLIAFSWLVIDGFRLLKIELSAEDAEAYHFVWRVFARTMGIHPPGEQKSWAFIPETVAEAREFYEAYSARHYVGAANNQEGVALAGANLRMLNTKMPPLAPRIYMHLLMGAEACERLAIRKVPLMFVTKFVYANFPRAWVALWRIIDRRKGGVAKHDEITQSILQRLVVYEYKDGVPSLRVPRDVSEMGEVVRGTHPGLNYGREQFQREVFPRELGDLTARRNAVGIDASKLNGSPDADKGLVGLALSGGGIRSATFALGVVQALARRGCLKMIDYLSTVSGGGYTGSMLSSVLNDPDAGLEGQAFPLNFKTGQVEPPALRHVRSGSNYLAGGGLLSAARLPAILLRGLLLNLALLLPYIMLAALVTFMLFPFMHESGAMRYIFFTTLLFFGLFVAAHPVVAWLYGPTLSWDQRDRAENNLTLALVAFIATVTMALLADPISNAVTTNWLHVRAVLLEEIASPLDGADWWKWAIVGAILYGAIRATKVAESLKRRTSRAFLYLLGLSAPAAAYGAYLLVLVWFARSPYLDIRHADELDRAAADSIPVITDTTLLSDLRANGLDVDETSRVTVNPHDGRTRSWEIHAGAEHTYRIFQRGTALRMSGTNFGRGLARKALRADSAARPDSVGKDTTLDATFTRLVETQPLPVLRDAALLADLNSLGVAADTISIVTYEYDSGKEWWTLGPNLNGETYRIDINPLPRGLIFADVDLGPAARLRGTLPTTGDSARLNQVLLAVMLQRGASVDTGSQVVFYPGDSSWTVQSHGARNYRITLEGRGGGLDPNPGSREFLKIQGVSFDIRTHRSDLWFTVITLLALLLNLMLIDVNVTSPHGFWRDRLSRVFLFRARWFGRPVSNDGLKLSELGTLNPAVPYHLVNTSLNLASSKVEDLPGRGADFFVFSRRFVGSYATGYCRTEAMEASDAHINLGTAMAISSAAVAPNSGTVTVKPLVPMLTFLNVRQDYWAPNPWYVQASSAVRRIVARFFRPGPKYLFREALGLLHARGAFVNLSDGGHIENLAVYELLRRRCKLIVAADAEHDPTMSCASLATLIRYARIDLGIEIEINTDPLTLDDTRRTQLHWTIGTIKYGTSKEGKPETGFLLYVKSSVTGDEAPYVKDYRARNPDFPQETTADQFFDEAQFESYRALGYHAMNGALKAAMELDTTDKSHGSLEAMTAVRTVLNLKAERFSESMEALR